jgi:hypothetical protein
LGGLALSWLVMRGGEVVMMLPEGLRRVAECEVALTVKVVMEMHLNQSPRLDNEQVNVVPKRSLWKSRVGLLFTSKENNQSSWQEDVIDGYVLS